MRHLLCVVFCLLASLSLAQRREGVYKPSSGDPVQWKINENHALIWGGAPYLPVGLRIQGTPAEIAKAKDAHVSDLFVRLPANGAGWTEAFAALDAAGMSYVVGIDSLAPMAKGFAIEPEGYRVTGITEPKTVTITIPGAQTALAVLVTARDMDVQKVERVTTPDGRFSLKVEPLNSLEHILLVYPEMTSLQQPDLWEGLDKHRDVLLTSLMLHKPGKGLRGFVNPLGAMTKLPDSDSHFVPEGSFFRYEFRAFLENKYRNVETAQRSWSMSSSGIENWDGMARLIPLWSNVKGVQRLWDPTTDQLFNCDARHSSIWKDIQEVVSQTTMRRYGRLVADIRSQADVPVVQEWGGWAAPYEGDQTPVDGIGMRAFGTSPSDLTESGSRATSSILRWTTPGWLFASSVDFGGATDADTKVSAVFDDLTSLGARGLFVTTEDPKVVAAVVADGAKRRTDSTTAQFSPQAVFFPENATNPAIAQRLAGGKWWLPAPVSGNRIDMGSQFYAYRLQNGSHSFVAIWTAGVRGRFKLRMLEPKKATFTSIDGTDPAPKFSKNGIEVALSEMPLLIAGIDELPVPELAYEETALRFQDLIKLAEATKRDTTEEQYYFKDNLNGFDRNPGGSFSVMRQVFRRLNARLAQYTWIEAETSKDNNFSDIAADPGCSGGANIELTTQLRTDAQTYYASYDVPVKNQLDQDVWLAARIPTALRHGVRVMMGGQVLTVDGEPLSPYGAGFGWYKLGTTRFAGSMTKVRIEVDATEGADMAVDAVLLTPSAFAPHGVAQPDAIAFSPLTTGKRKKG